MSGLIALAVVWGSSFLFVKLASPGFEPLAIANGRILFGLAALAIAAPVLRVRVPRSRRFWFDAAVLGLTLCAIPFSLQAWALQRIDSTLGSVLNAMTPLATVIVGALMFRVKMSLGQVVGIAVGLVGVGVAVGLGGDDFAGSSVVGSVAMAGSTLFYGFAFNWSARRIPPETNSIAVAIAQNATAGLITLPGAIAVSVTGRFSPMAHGLPLHHVAVSTPAVAALVALGAFGTGLAYLLNQRNIATLGAAAASTVTFLVPIVSITLGVVLLGEVLRARHLIGALIIILGVLLVQGRLRGVASRIFAIG